MSRPLRIEYPGALYHLTSRGNARANIVDDDTDRQLFTEVLGAVVDRFGWLCHAWCLMDNHYHLLVETPTANLSRGMRQLNGVYTQRINRRHDRVGHVFQGRFRAIVVEREPHLLELCRYVVLNPVRAGMVSRARDWRWSSFRATAGYAPTGNFEHRDWILAQFDRDPETALKAYRCFVAGGMKAARPWDQLASPHILGSPSFRDDLLATLGPAGREVTGATRHAAPPTLEALRNRHPERAEWMARAYREYGYLLREIAEAAGVHYATVSKIITAWEAGPEAKSKT